MEEIELDRVVCIEKDGKEYYAYYRGDISTGIGITKRQYLELKNLEVPSLEMYYDGKRRPK